MPLPYTFCHYCGSHLISATRTPDGLKCGECLQTTYQNTLPVAALIVPCGPPRDGVERIFAVRRGIEPYKGRLALPAGYIVRESWEAAAAREAHEEINVTCRFSHSPVERPKHILTESSEDGSRLLVVGAVGGAFMVGPFVPNHEVTERVEYTPTHQEQLCFPIHRKALARYWDMRGVAHTIIL